MKPEASKINSFKAFLNYSKIQKSIFFRKNIPARTKPKRSTIIKKNKSINIWGKRGAVLFYWGLFIFKLLGVGICGAKSIGGGFKVNMNGLLEHW